MLILSRKDQQSVRIGNDITVMVVRLGNGVVRLGITAPKGVPIVRTELLTESTPETELHREKRLRPPVTEIGDPGIVG